MQPIQPIQLPPLQNQVKNSDVTQTENTFANMLTGMVSEVNDQQQAADKAIQEVHAGEAKNLHEAMIAMEQADISIRFMVQVRNKAMEAYQEMMRMQV